jgi:hypothetical protein
MVLYYYNSIHSFHALYLDLIFSDGVFLYRFILLMITKLQLCARNICLTRRSTVCYRISVLQTTDLHGVCFALASLLIYRLLDCQASARFLPIFQRTHVTYQTPGIHRVIVMVDQEVSSPVQAKPTMVCGYLHYDIMCTMFLVRNGYHHRMA